MCQSKRFLFMIWIFLFFLSFGVLMAEPEAGKHRSVSKALEKWKSKETDIVFYGRIVDLNNNPVEDALVSVDAPAQTGFRQRKSRELAVHTSRDGSFEVNAKAYNVTRLRGSFLFIRKIEKDGYEYLRGRSPHSFTYHSDYADRFVPDKQKPVLLYLRKKMDPVFLIQNNHLQMKISTKESGNVIGYDCVRGKSGPLGKAKDFVDLHLQATFNVDDSKWQVTLSAGGTTPGIIAGNEWLSEAPENGYQSRYTFVPEDHKLPPNKYLYVRSRNPSIFTRYEIEYINANKEFFRLSGKSMTNPYGDRNIEPAIDVPYNEGKHLRDEARSALNQGKQPKKPNLKALIKAEKEKKK